MTNMKNYPESSAAAAPERQRTVYPTASDVLKTMTTEALAEHYVHLDEIKLAGETRVGRHPSGRAFPEAREHDARVREVLDAGLTLIVREMAAVQRELSTRLTGGLLAALQLIGKS